MTDKERIRLLRDALLNLLEVQVRPSTVYRDEWRDATEQARYILRDTRDG